MKLQKYMVLRIVFVIALLSSLGISMPEDKNFTADQITNVSAGEQEECVSAENGQELFEDDHFNQIENTLEFCDCQGQFPVSKSISGYSEYDKSPWLPPRLA